MSEHTTSPLTISKSRPLSRDNMGDFAIQDAYGYIIGEAYEIVGRKAGPIKNGEGHVIGQAIIPGEYITRPAEANARLWAAAPDLLEALEIALNTVECASIDVQTGADLPWYTLAKRAIARTQGLKVGL